VSGLTPDAIRCARGTPQEKKKNPHMLHQGGGLGGGCVSKILVETVRQPKKRKETIRKGGGRRFDVWMAPFQSRTPNRQAKRKRKKTRKHSMGKTNTSAAGEKVVLARRKYNSPTWHRGASRVELVSLLVRRQKKVRVLEKGQGKHARITAIMRGYGTKTQVAQRERAILPWEGLIPTQGKKQAREERGPNRGVAAKGRTRLKLTPERLRKVAWELRAGVSGGGIGGGKKGGTGCESMKKLRSTVNFLCVGVLGSKPWVGENAGPEDVRISGRRRTTGDGKILEKKEAREKTPRMEERGASYSAGPSPGKLENQVAGERG